MIVSELNAQAELAQYRILSRDAHSSHALWIDSQSMKPLNYTNADQTWVRHAEVGTLGFEPLLGLPNPSQYDFLIYKGLEIDMHPYGACFHDLAEHISTGLIEWLQAKSVDCLLVGGLATDFCVKATVLQLLKHTDLEICLNLAACRGIDVVGERRALAEMRELGVKIFDDAQAIRLYLGKNE